MSAPRLVWLRRDLRLADQAALAAAARAGPVLPVYILDDGAPGPRAMGGAARWWLHHSLQALDAALRALGSQLILRRGHTEERLAQIAEESGTAEVHCLRHYEPWWQEAERAVAQRLRLVRHDGNYLAPPGAVRSGNGTPYKIYTPFWRALRQQMPPPVPAEAPSMLAAPARWPTSERIVEWGLTPHQPDWAAGFGEIWTPGEAGAKERLAVFATRASDYGARRDLPSEEATARLSPHLHFGEISPATIWHALADAGGSVETFLSELAWRDYAQNVIAEYPDYAERNARTGFDAMRWRMGGDADADLRAWQQGRTGYPIVDAGMRQLWASGWMHNRVRMIAASFLIKHLLIDWRRGERWFWDTLIDADYANNAVNWQWVAGTGIDSNMFSRIMAPLGQSVKFDAADYIRRWVPELAHLDDDAVHDPEEAGRRPADYTPKIIGHPEARARALAAHATMRDPRS
ncbi:cryptochrome/photolyase family protein [Sphingopyxis sp. MWB1]|uniref:cryptochrome/photolyase family protein n=1 Tax=Sphingopyxis sp. MWB1 TaxID=1537715 RepID=UPI00051A4452|nr:deoxyribodipyrimidine photo-lyase [Sphingopyxis sp. MWB1]